jgi:hypothetical protein
VEFSKDRYRVIDPFNQLVRIMVESGGMEPVLRLQLEVWEKQGEFEVPEEMLVEARHKAKTARLLRDLTETDSLNETLPVGFFFPRPSAEVVELRASIEPDMPAVDEEADLGSVSPSN